MTNIGNRIKTLRESRGLTQDAFAELLHVTRQTVSNYENGRSQPDLNMLAEIARVLETDANTLLGETSAPMQPDVPAAAEERKRAIRRLVIGGALLVLLLLQGIPLKGWADAQHADFELLPRFYMKLWFYPALWAIGGWVFMQGLEVVAGIRPLQARWCRYAKWVVLVGMFFSQTVVMAAFAHIPMPIFPYFWLQLWNFLRQPAWYGIFGAALWLLGFLTGKRSTPTA